MTSIIEKSLKEYEAYLNDKPNNVKVDYATIPHKKIHSKKQ